MNKNIEDFMIFIEGKEVELGELLTAYKDRGELKETNMSLNAKIAHLMAEKEIWIKDIHQTDKDWKEREERAFNAGREQTQIGIDNFKVFRYNTWDHYQAQQEKK